MEKDPIFSPQTFARVRAAESEVPDLPIIAGFVQFGALVEVFGTGAEVNL